MNSMQYLRQVVQETFRPATDDPDAVRPARDDEGKPMLRGQRPQRTIMLSWLGIAAMGVLIVITLLTPPPGGSAGFAMLVGIGFIVICARYLRMGKRALAYDTAYSLDTEGSPDDDGPSHAPS